MGLLEKLRPQPKWKHTDPSVRLEGLQEIEDTDQESLAALATDDPDARVRRAAVARVSDAVVLATILRNESDASVRDHAATRLAGLAEQGDERVALAAVSSLATLGRQRELATVARGSHLDSVRRAAVEQVSDPKALSAIARQSADATARLVAIRTSGRGNQAPSS